MGHRHRHPDRGQIGHPYLQSAFPGQRTGCERTRSGAVGAKPSRHHIVRHALDRLTGVVLHGDGQGRRLQRRQGGLANLSLHRGRDPADHGDHLLALVACQIRSRDRHLVRAIRHGNGDRPGQVRSHYGGQAVHRQPFDPLAYLAGQGEPLGHHGLRHRVHGDHGKGCVRVRRVNRLPTRQDVGRKGLVQQVVDLAGVGQFRVANGREALEVLAGDQALLQGTLYIVLRPGQPRRRLDPQELGEEGNDLAPCHHLIRAEGPVRVAQRLAIQLDHLLGHGDHARCRMGRRVGEGSVALRLLSRTLLVEGPHQEIDPLGSGQAPPQVVGALNQPQGCQPFRSGGHLRPWQGGEGPTPLRQSKRQNGERNQKQTDRLLYPLCVHPFLIPSRPNHF